MAGQCGDGDANGDVLGELQSGKSSGGDGNACGDERSWCSCGDGDDGGSGRDEGWSGSGNDDSGRVTSCRMEYFFLYCGTSGGSYGGVLGSFLH